MKALSVYQPWASLIMLGAKPFEFRAWDFSKKPAFAALIGKRLVVHAAQRPVRMDEVDDLLRRLRDPVRSTGLIPDIAEQVLQRLKKSMGAGSGLPTSCGLGTVVLGQPVKASEAFPEWQADSTRGNHHLVAWPMSAPKPFAAPIPCRGYQGFWNWSAS